VGLTNPIVQERAGVDEPDYGIVLDDMVFESPIVRPRSAYIHPKIEAELAFVLKHDILTADLEAIEAAIDYVTTAIELVDNRYFDYRMSIVDTIADNAACAGLVTGPVRVPYGEIDLREVEMILYRGDEELTRGLASNVMGNPINAMQWIAETSLRIGKPLLAGEIVLSGSIGLIVDWDPDITYTARYSHGLGEITAVLSTEENHA
jgi:2-keto-4-pentenoate hydratase